MSRQRAVEGAIRRARGMSQVGRGNMQAAALQATDWSGACRRCGTRSIGTIAQLTQPCANCGFPGPGKNKADIA